MGDPRLRGLPPDLQAQMRVVLTLGAQLQAIKKLTEEIQLVLDHEAPKYAAFGEALAYHVEAVRTYFAEAERVAYGIYGPGVSKIKGANGG